MMLFNMAGTTRRGIWSYLPALNDINIKEISVNPLELDMEVDTEQSHGHIERGSENNGHFNSSNIYPSFIEGKDQMNSKLGPRKSLVLSLVSFTNKHKFKYSASRSMSMSIHPSSKEIINDERGDKSNIRKNYEHDKYCFCGCRGVSMQTKS